MIKLTVVLSTFLALGFTTSTAQLPFESEPLTEKGDLSTLMVQGIDQFLTLRTQQVKLKRSDLWKYDFSSVPAFNKSTLANRNLLASRLGVADNRTTSCMEILTDSSLKQLAANGEGFIVYAVRWKVLNELWAEGLLVQPTGKINARTVMIPDADIIPEVLTGFNKWKGPTWGAAGQLAKKGCQVLIPVLVNRQDDFSGSEPLQHFTNQPHREWIYRQSYELGRHIIGYELQKVLAGIDWFQSENKKRGIELPIGIAGYGEGGMLALYAAAIDHRITATLVSGYFNEREQLWNEPIYRNVFGLLKHFGDAELAVMAWPGKVIIEYSAGPLISGPPVATKNRSGAAPGKLGPLQLSTALAEWNRAKAIVPASGNHLHWVQGLSGFVDHPFSDKALSILADQLKLKKGSSILPGIKSIAHTNWLNIAERQRRTVMDLESNVQKTLLRCSKTRDREFWETLKGDIQAQEPVKAIHREKLRELMGALSPLPSALQPRARILEETDKWTRYELTLDVFQDVFAWGILMIPKNMKAGERRPVVVCQHGLEGLPQDVVTTDSTAENYHYYKGLATRLTEKGYITFCPHNPYRGYDKFRVLQRKANPLGLTLFSIIIAQHQRIVDWLSSQSFVDPRRIALYGLSYGGKTAMRVPALVNGYALSICSADFNEWVLKNASTNEDFSYLFLNEYEMPEWNLGHTFNYAEMAALIAPRPFMVERGIHDGVAVDEWVDYEFAKVRRHYFAIGRPQLCAIEHFDGPHAINGVGTFEFLDKYLPVNFSEDTLNARLLEKYRDIRLPESDVHRIRVKNFVEESPDADYFHASEKAYESFNDMKFGIRIHWGLYSMLKMNKESWGFLKLSNEKKQAYQNLYKEFNPTDFDAEEWMNFFDSSGLKCFAFTTKHHEGFSMFDTKTRVKRRANYTASTGPSIENCDLAYSIMETPFKRDIVKELCDAAHKHKIKIDLYFSHPDWYDADFRPYNFHPLQTSSSKDSAAYYYGSDGDNFARSYSTIMTSEPGEAETSRMVSRHRQQLTELLTRYGKIDMICLDQWMGPRVWPQMKETLKQLRKIQPDIMFRARGIGNYGDYYTPEEFVPGGKENTKMPWMVIHVLGNSFSYDSVSAHYKGSPWIINNLIDAVAKGGNFMVGIGPDGTGKFHPTAVKQLLQAGAWLRINGEGIYSSRARNIWKEGESIRFTTTKDQKYVYAFLTKWPGNEMVLETVQPKPHSPIYMLGYKTPLKWKYKNGKLTIRIPGDLQEEKNRPCTTAWVIKIEQ